MNKESFLTISHLLSDGIGSIKANFKSGIELSAFLNDDYDHFHLLFSNRNDYTKLGSISLNKSDIDLYSKSRFEHDSKYAGEIVFTIPASVSGHTKAIVIKLIFWDEHIHSALFGECFIMECNYVEDID